MKLYIIGDLHLSFASDKPMDIFGAQWENHAERIRKWWESTVAEEDIVIINGDISWALKTEDAVPDLIFVNNLPGRKVIMKGNHELWWTSLTKLDSLKRLHNLDKIEFMYNNSIYIQEKNVIICGTRGWKSPGDADFSEADAKILRREAMRFEMSVNDGIGKTENISRQPTNMIAIFHYPPFCFSKRDTDGEMLAEIHKYGIKRCYFGHIHGLSNAKYDENGDVLPVWKNGDTEFYLTSCDYLDFRGIEIKV